MRLPRRPVEQLTRADLPGCLALARDRGWPSEERKWRLLLEVGIGFGVRDKAGSLIGTAIITRYGAQLAVISMVLVASRYGGQGIGRTLITDALAHAETAAVVLNATDQGRPLYERVGFLTVGSTHSYHGALSVDAAGSPAGGQGATRPARKADLAAVRALDSTAIGADRGQVLTRLFQFAEQLRVVETGGKVTGFAGAWRNGEQLTIGPVIAETPAEATLLMRDLAVPAADPVRVDLPGERPQLQDWALRCGLHLRSTTAVMVHGARQLPGQRAHWFAPFMQALG